MKSFSGKLQCNFGTSGCVWMQSLGSQEEQDPSMTYSGLKCGSERLCVDQVGTFSPAFLCPKKCPEKIVPFFWLTKMVRFFVY